MQFLTEDLIGIKLIRLTTHVQNIFGTFRINRPGGTGRITKIHYADQDVLRTPSFVIGLDVKYTVNSGHDLHLDPELVKPHVELETRGRRRGPAVVPQIESENDIPDSCYHENIWSEKGTKRKVHVASKKGSASKIKVSGQKKIDVVRGKSLRAATKSTKSSKCSTNNVPIEPGIPLEIEFKAAIVSNTPNSVCSKSLTSLSNCSPLGEEGAESQLLTTASYDHMLQQFRPSVGTSTAHCPIVYGTNAMCHSNDMDFDILKLQISPSSESNKMNAKSFFKSTPLVSGSFSKEHQNFTGGAKFSVSKRVGHFDKIVNANRSAKDEEKVDRVKFNESVTLRANPTLRDVYENEVKKASQFVGAIVKGHIKVRSGDSSMSATIREKRLNHFRSLLNDLLFDSDGMIESEDLANNLRKFAKSSINDVFDYTDHDVKSFVSELCAQNKIMQTEGWIYNI